ASIFREDNFLPIPNRRCDHTYTHNDLKRVQFVKIHDEHVLQSVVMIC
nr:hypothetical protein [Tanacetum cinerariifolium]